MMALEQDMLDHAVGGMPCPVFPQMIAMAGFVAPVSDNVFADCSSNTIEKLWGK